MITPMTVSYTHLDVYKRQDLDYQVEEKIQKIKTTLTSVIERYVAGEEIRIWYSYNPDELCGCLLYTSCIKCIMC